MCGRSKTTCGPIRSRRDVRVPAHRPPRRQVAAPQNVRYQPTPDQIVRSGGTRALGPEHAKLSAAGIGTLVCDAQGCRVTGPRPDIRSRTVDNWARRGLLRSRAGRCVTWTLFCARMRDDAKTGGSGSATIDLHDRATSVLQTYAVQTTGQQGACSACGTVVRAVVQFRFTSNVVRA